MKIVKIAVVAIILLFLTAILAYKYLSYELPFLGQTQIITIDENSALDPYPVPNENYQEVPALSAKAATVIDNKTGITLLEKNPDLKHLPASTTKLMTALIALENCLPQETVKVGYVEQEGTKMNLKVGDTITVENLLYGLLVPSGNDAAYALAYSCAQNYQDFIVSMNKKAKELKMVNTHFANPAGFDDPLQYSTARDLTKLARAAVANPLISKIVKTKSVVVSDINGTKTYYLENVNELLGIVPGIEGVKTGQTEGSLENLVTKTARDGHSVITVVLGSQDRFGESQKLIEWAYANHKWVEP